MPYQAFDYLSMLRFKLIHASKWGPWSSSWVPGMNDILKVRFRSEALTEIKNAYTENYYYIYIVLAAETTTVLINIIIAHIYHKELRCIPSIITCSGCLIFSTNFMHHVKGHTVTGAYVVLPQCQQTQMTRSVVNTRTHTASLTQNEDIQTPRGTHCRYGSYIHVVVKIYIKPVFSMQMKNYQAYLGPMLGH